LLCELTEIMAIADQPYTTVLSAILQSSGSSRFTPT
jgi:hypothetical protein